MKHISSFDNFINESWLQDERDYVLPKPSNDVVWNKAEGNVTDDTFDILKKLQPNFHDVSLFSWHPNIQTAQYFDKITSYNKSNYNSRIWIAGSIIVKRTQESPKEDRTFSDYRVIEHVINEYPYMNVQGGSGCTEKGRHVCRMQIFFKGDDHSHSKVLKEEKITAGAYTYNGREWLYIPVEDFNVIPKVKLENNEILEYLKQFIEICDDVKTVVLKNFQKTQPRLEIFCENFKKIVEIMIVNIDLFDVWGKKEGIRYKSGLKITDALIELNIFPEYVNKQISENPDNWKEILKNFGYERRGKIQTKKFGI